MIRVAINGFGRIGRMTLRLLQTEKDIEVVAINDLSNPLELAYLYKYDSIHRKTKDKVTYEDDKLIVNGNSINVYNESDPSLLPWKTLNVDVVYECTGAFTSKEKSMMHINAGAKKVIISAPTKDDTKTIVFNVNDEIINKEDTIISCASCTTNCLAPVVNLIHKNYKIKKGFMTTIHAMTNDQTTLDISHKKGIESRRGRAASLNIIPTSTGAATQIGKVIPELNGLLDGISFRVPVGDGSVIDLNVEVETKVTKEKINSMFKSNQNDTIKIINAPIVSSDIIGEECTCLVDGLLTNVIESKDSTMIKIVAWYDNEIGYTSQMIKTMKAMFR